MCFGHFGPIKTTEIKDLCCMAYNQAAFVRFDIYHMLCRVCRCMPDVSGERCALSVIEYWIFSLLNKKLLRFLRQQKWMTYNFIIMGTMAATWPHNQGYCMQHRGVKQFF